MKNTNRSVRVLPDLLFLLVACLIAYWPVAFHVLSLKNDALNYFLPVRFQISEAIHHHYYPFWSPYFNLGYPLHGDMQSGVWNPIVQIFSLFGPYTLYSLQLETLLYIFLCGAGMYLLLRYLAFNRLVCLTVAAAYMLCGFNSDSCQYLNWIASAAFLPFIVLWYMRMLAETSLASRLFAAFFLYLQFVSAYPAHFVVTLYLLLAIFVYHSWKTSRQQNMSFLRMAAAGLRRHIPFLICFVVLALPAILSYAQYLPLSERGTGASYEDAMSDSLHPLLLVSYLTPLAVFKMPWHDITDMLLRNSYFNIIIFLFAIAAFFVKTADPRIRFARVAVIIFQLMSLGRFGGLRPLAYYVLPLMNSFRHPACIQIFTIFFACILGAWSLQRVADGRQLSPYRITIVGCLIVLAGLLIYSLSGVGDLFHQLRDLGVLLRHPNGSLAEELKQLTDGLSLRQALAAEIFLQLPFLAALLLHALPKRDLRSILGLATVNSIVHVMLFTPFTVVKKDPAAYIQHVLNETIVKGYPTPSIGHSLQYNSRDDSAHFNEIGCANMYNKLIGRNSYRISPSNLLSQNEFWFNDKIRDDVMRYPLLFRRDTAGAARLSIQAFTPEYFRFTSDAAEKGFYVLLQNEYPLWKLKVDGHSQAIVRTDVTFMGMDIPAGHHTIELRYSDAHLIITFWLSSALFVLLLLWLPISSNTSSRIHC